MIKAGVYRHFRGQYYRVIASVKNNITGEEFVVYETFCKCDKNEIFLRAKRDFLKNAKVDGIVVPCFTYIGDPLYKQERFPVIHTVLKLN